MSLLSPIPPHVSPLEGKLLNTPLEFKDRPHRSTKEIRSDILDDLDDPEIFSKMSAQEIIYYNQEVSKNKKTPAFKILEYINYEKKRRTKMNE